MQNLPKISFYDIANSLEDKYMIFNKFWTMVRPVFTKDLPTAGVAFNKLGDCIDFLINPEFWDECSMEQKQFVISHECLHVILSHGIRMSTLDNNYRKVANIAMDLVVNYLLVDRFGFNRNLIDPLMPIEGSDKLFRKFCWLDTVLPDTTLEPDRSFEYYYNILKEKVQWVDCDSFDNHDGLESFNSNECKRKIMEGFKDSCYDEMSNIKKMLEDKEECKNKTAGTEDGGMWKQFKLEKPTYKRKWEEIIKNWTKRALTSIEIEQWACKPRRMVNIHTDCMLPADMEIEETEKNRIDVMFFLDTSGSCAHLAERFLKAVRSVPPSRFNVQAFCFDTHTYELELKTGKLSGFGGTCFKTIDQRVRKESIKNGRHPGAVFVITDGYGTEVSPQQPKKWYWLLSEYHTDCIPKECNIYDLNKFE